MADLKRKGDLAELAVATDLIRQGYRVALPFGEDCDYDLIVDRGEALQRVQVKYVTPRDNILEIHAGSISLTGGRVRAKKLYTAATIDWLAAYDPASGRCYYVPASEFGTGRHTITLRHAPARNNQRSGIRMADDYARLAAG